MQDKIIPIDINIKPARKRSDSRRHQILKANVEKIIRKDKKMTCTFETDNFDVYAEQGGIVVECGQTDGRKLLDAIENVFTNIKNINEFWVLDFYDHKKNSMLYKFRINKKGKRTIFPRCHRKMHVLDRKIDIDRLKFKANTRK